MYPHCLAIYRWNCCFDSKYKIKKNCSVHSHNIANSFLSPCLLFFIYGRRLFCVPRHQHSSTWNWSIYYYECWSLAWNRIAADASNKKKTVGTTRQHKFTRNSNIFFLYFFCVFFFVLFQPSTANYPLNATKNSQFKHSLFFSSNNIYKYFMGLIRTLPPKRTTKTLVPNECQPIYYIRGKWLVASNETEIGRFVLLVVPFVGVFSKLPWITRTHNAQPHTHT